jgi:hypothetical protein
MAAPAALLPSHRYWPALLMNPPLSGADVLFEDHRALEMGMGRRRGVRTAF